MTRINVVPVGELCDQHLLAEQRELVRIPNELTSGRLKYEYDDRPDEYTTGEGHLKFFTNRLRYLFIRYQQLTDECERRGLHVEFSWPDNFIQRTTSRYWNDYAPTRSALHSNRARLRERMPVKPKFSQQISA